MRFLIRLESLDDIWIPINYQHALSSMIYHFIRNSDSDLSSKLHHSKDFKFFNFSRMESENKSIKQKTILFPKNDIAFFNISSPDSDILRSTVEGMFSEKEVELLGKKFRVLSPIYLDPPDFTHTARFRTLSPIYIDTIRDGRRWDLFPTDPEWKKRIEENSRKKYAHYFGKDYTGNLNILDIRKMSTKRINVGGQSWRAANAEFTLKAEPDMLRFLWDTGIGTKNSQGFGCLHYLGER